MSDIPSGKVQGALFDLREFLSDLLSPVSVAESIGLLLRCPPDLAAVEIRTWAAAQFKGRGEGVPISDYFFHALEKIRSLGELKVVAQAPLRSYLDLLCAEVLTYCPEEDRALLLKNLVQHEHAETTLTSSVQILRRQPGSERPLSSWIRASRQSPVAEEPSVKAYHDLDHGLRRFSLLVERWKRDLHSAAGTPGKQPELATEILSTVIRQSHSGTELEQHLKMLRESGIEAPMDQIFRALGRQLPDWAVVAPAHGAGSPAPVPPVRAAESMHRLLTLSEDPDELGRHFHEIVRAAIEQFNEGFLGRAATMLEVAERIIREQRISPNFVESVRKTSHKFLDVERLRKTAETPEKHPLLRKILGFFLEMTAQSLLSELWGEQKRDRRKLLLLLLEAYGVEARALVLERLKGFIPQGQGDDEGYYQRNLLYLLRRIHRPAPPSEEEEAEMVGYLAVNGSSLLVLKEAIVALGQLKHRKAELVLTQRLADFEGMLLKPEHLPLAPSDLLGLLDKTVGALVHIGTRNALRAVIEHGLKQQPQLGNTAGRLAELGSADLSAHKDLIKRLVDALQKDLPKKILGLFGSKGSTAALPIITALSGTHTPEVRELFESIVKRFPEPPLGPAAAKVLASPVRPVPASVPGHPALVADPTGHASGDLDVFGLPNLLQSLADSRSSADLILIGRDGKQVASLLLDAGRLVRCHNGSLPDDEAFYQLFEKPLACRFNLQSRRDVSPSTELEKPPQPLLPLLLEATRRYDELQRARALVPDDVPLQPTGTKATAPPNEADREFLRGLWTRSSLGATPADCEVQITADSYRIRRTLAHWVEEGSLRLVSF